MGFDVKGKEKLNEERPRFGFKDKVIASLTISGLAVFGSLVAQPKEADAYTSNTHKLIASNGIFEIKNDKGESVVTKLYEKVNDRGDTGASILMKYATMPDFDENDGGIGVKGGFKGHFYDPGTATNYTGDKTDTANVRFSNHYNDAVKNYKEGSKEVAYQELGRALHYLQDMNEPHHAANLPGIEGTNGVYLTHNDYEGWAEKNFYNYSLTTAPNEIYDYALNNNPWIIGHESAVNAKKYAYFVKDFRFELDNNNKRTAAKNTLPYAQKITAGVINKFLTEVSEVNK
jgi:hypothetical protein